MPSLQNVSYNSSRVQRAYRINNIETMKLQHQLHLLEKERLHRQRLTNQDIRCIALTLDYIQTCSGHSPEALAPQGEYVQEEDSRAENGPCFLYGERIVSRKKRRTLRPQSAMDKSFSRSISETASAISSADDTPRPQSSPAKRTTFITHLNRDETECFGSQSELSRSSGSIVDPRFKPAWTEEPMPEVTKVLLRANAENENKNKRNSLFERSRDYQGSGSGSAVLKTLTRNLRIKSQSESKRQSFSEMDENPGSRSPERRGSRVGEMLKRGSLTPGSLQSSFAGPMASAMQRQYIMDSKKAMNSTKSEVIQKRVNKFVSNSSH